MPRESVDRERKTKREREGERERNDPRVHADVDFFFKWF